MTGRDGAGHDRIGALALDAMARSRGLARGAGSAIGAWKQGLRGRPAWRTVDRATDGPAIAASWPRWAKLRA
jgi:hypothetical protein